MITVRVYGEKRTARAFRELGLRVSDLKGAWDRIGASVKRDAVAFAPTLTGRLAANIRQGRTKSQAVVRVGNKTSVPYAGVQNYGWPARNIEAKLFMNRALLRNKGFAEREVHNELERVIRRVGLK